MPTSAQVRARFLSAACLIALAIPASAQTGSAADYSRAEALIRNHQWDQGLEVLQQLLRTAPDSPKILNLTGLAYTGKGDLGQAKRYFESALRVEPEFVPALKNLGIDEITLGDTAGAREHLESAARLAPEDPVVNLYLGEIYFRQQNFKAAAEHLRLAGPFVQHNPDLLASLAVAELNSGDRADALKSLDEIPAASLKPQTQLIVGVNLAKADLWQQAIPYLDAAHLVDPGAPDIAYDLALCYMSLKKYPEAINALQTVVAGEHDSADIEDLLAEAYEANHETQHAVDALRRSIALDPQHEDSYIEFASICIDHQDFANAEKVLQVGLNSRPKSARLLFERGILNAMQDHFEAAEKDFQSAADLAPTDNSAYVGLGVTFMETGDTARAIPLLRARLKDHPNDANLLYLLGEALLRTSGQQPAAGSDEARTCLERAVSLNPKLVEAHISLGTVYLRDGRLQDAVNQLERARSLDPNANSAYWHLAVAYRRLGQVDKSRQVLQELKALADRERNGARQPLTGNGVSAVKGATPQ